MAEAHLCTSFHFVTWEFLYSSCKSILFNVPVQDLKVSCTLSSKGPFFCSLDLQENCRNVYWLDWLSLCNFPNDWKANYTIIIFLMVCCLLYRCRRGFWLWVQGREMESAMRRDHWNESFWTGRQVGGVGGGRYSLWWPIRVGSARKGYYLFQASGIWKVGISLVEVYKRVGKSVIWVCERAQKS